MKELRTIGLLVVAMIGAGIVGGILYGVSKLENKTITALITVLVVSIALAIASVGIGFGSALWRKAGNPPRPERQVIRERETRIIDGRPAAPPQVIQAQPMTTPMLPELLRAAYAAGARLPAGAAQHGRDERNEPIGTGWVDVWDGQIVDDEETVDSPFTRRTTT